MLAVRNRVDKLICYVDEKAQAVEINIKGCKTTIQFKANGQVEIINE